MATTKLQPWAPALWELERKQHGVVSRGQLLDLGMGAAAIRHRLASGRLHPLMRGIYVVGRPGVDIRGRWMAAVLACGQGALLSHDSAAALWGIRRQRPGAIHVVVPEHVFRRRPGIHVHRRTVLDERERRLVHGIPVTDPISTLVDLAMLLSAAALEAAVNEASHLDLVNPEELRAAIDSRPERPGVGRLRALLDRPTYVMTDTRLEQLFLPIAHAAGLPTPQTQAYLNGYRVDFYWPELRVVVETDSLRYHRTAARQAADQRRDQAHIRSGLIPLRFSHWQVRYEPDDVRRTLATVAARVAASRPSGHHG